MSEDYSILLGADGQLGLESLIQMIRFDEQMQVYIVPVEIVDEEFEVMSSKDTDIKHKYTWYRKVSIRQGNKICSTDIFHSKEIDRYYVSVARIAPHLQQSTENWLKYNINGKYGNYFLERCNGRLALVKGLSV